MLDLLFLSDNLAISIFSAVFHKFVSSDLCGSSTNGGKLFSPKYPPGALASVLGCVVTLQLGAFSVVLETTLSGITALPLGAFAALMQPIHLAIGLVEGLITAAVLLFVYQTRPELLQGAAGTGAKNRCSRKAALAILAAAALVIGGGLSLLASSSPDGLEWSLFGNEEAGYSANMGLDEEQYGAQSAAAEKAAAVQEKTSFLPDYGFADSDSAAGTSVSGIVGCVIVAGHAARICAPGRVPQKNKNPAAPVYAASRHAVRLAALHIFKTREGCSVNKAEQAGLELLEIDELAAQDSILHRLNPLSKLFVTVFYIAVTVSFPKYALTRLVWMALFPVAGYQLAGLPMRLCFQKLRMVLPLVCAVGLLNPLFDRQIVVQVGTLAVSGGVLSMLTLILKGVFCLLASFLLMATTTIEAICRALRQLHVPKLLTNLLLLTFRYVGLLLSEVAVMQQAYSLRAPGQKGIHISAWGSFLGQLLLRSMDQAQALYESMELRGFSGEFSGAVRGRGSAASWPYALVCPALMLLARYFDLSALMGGLFV